MEEYLTVDKLSLPVQVFLGPLRIACQMSIGPLVDQIEHLVSRPDILRQAIIAGTFPHPNVERHRLPILPAVKYPNVHLRFSILPHGRSEDQINPVFRWRLALLILTIVVVGSDKGEIGPVFRGPGGVLGDSGGVKHLTVVRVEQVRVRVPKVRIVEHVVERFYVVKRISVVVHLLHVVVLEHGTDHVLWDVAEGVLVLVEEIAWVAATVHVNLKVFALGDVQKEEHVFQI